jgi:hypothetical protein
VWPAHAAVDHSYTKVTKPANGAVIGGNYGADGKSPTGFSVAVAGQAKSTCGAGFSSIKFSVSGPDGYSLTWPTMSSDNSTWSGGPSSAWDTKALAKNGAYSVRMTVTDRSSLLCGSETYPVKADVKVANAPQTPEWAANPAAASDDSARVTIKWKKNPEDDVVSYHIVRAGPDGTNTAVVPPDGCSLSSGVYTCEDTQFGANYSGTYTYQIFTLRSAPAGTGQECSAGSSARCVSSAGSDPKPVTLTKPTPSPSPSPSNPGTPTPGGGGTGGTTGGTGTSKSKNTSGSQVLSFSHSRSSSNEFYTGTYKTTLPYQDKTLLIGGGDATSTPEERQIEAASISDAAPNYRTIMLPVAGGLLAFLSAAHVRRLLIHF